MEYEVDFELPQVEAKKPARVHTFDNVCLACEG